MAMIAQLLAQQGQTGETNPLEWLKSFIPKNTVPGALSTQDEYNAYVESETLNGRQPMPRTEWLRMKQQELENGI